MNNQDSQDALEFMLGEEEYLIKKEYLMPSGSTVGFEIDKELDQVTLSKFEEGEAQFINLDFAEIAIIFNNLKLNK